MKKKLLKVSIISLIIIMLLQVSSFAIADKITLKTLTDKDTYTVGDKVTVTIDWTEKMECAEFYIKFDSTKLVFKDATYIDGTSLNPIMYNDLGKGNLKFGWYGNESTKMLFIFEAKIAGKVTISVDEPGGFADSNLDEPSSYDIATYGSKQITINAKQSENTNTGNNTTAGGNTNTGNSTTTKPSGNTNTGNNTTTGGNTNTGNSTTTKPSGNTNTGSSTTTKPSENTNTGSSTATKPTISNKVDNTTADGKIWQAGLDSNVIVAMIVVTMVGIIGFVKYRGLADI